MLSNGTPLFHWKLEKNVHSEGWSSGQGLPHYALQAGFTASATPPTDESPH